MGAACAALMATQDAGTDPRLVEAQAAFDEAVRLRKAGRFTDAIPAAVVLEVERLASAGVGAALLRNGRVLPLRMQDNEGRERERCGERKSDEQTYEACQNTLEEGTAHMKLREGKTRVALMWRRGQRASTSSQIQKLSRAAMGDAPWALRLNRLAAPGEVTRFRFWSTMR